MSVITISRQSGSEGDKVAHLLCERLGYAYFNKYLMVKLAQEMGWNSEKVFDESEDQHHAASLLDKILGSFTLPFSLTGGYQSPLPSESLESLKVRQVEQLIISAYEHGNVIIVGRGGQVVLEGKPDVLHVRVVAPLEKRIQTWMAREDLSYEAARKRVHERDKAHIDFVETFFDSDLNDCSLYDLVVNTNRYPPERAVDLILLALKSLEETI